MWFNYHKIELSRHFWQVGVFETRYKRSEEHTSELQSRLHLVCRLLLEKKNDNSVYVEFPVSNPGAVKGQFDLRENAKLSLLIWTTTPWTLPANMALAVHPDVEDSFGNCT